MVYVCYSPLRHVLQQGVYSNLIGSRCVSRTVPKHSMLVVSGCYSWYMYDGCILMCVCVPPPAKQPSLLMFVDWLRSPRELQRIQAGACLYTFGLSDSFLNAFSLGAREPEHVQAGACLYAFGLWGFVLNPFSLGSPRHERIKAGACLYTCGHE